MRRQRKRGIDGKKNSCTTQNYPVARCHNFFGQTVVLSHDKMSSNVAGSIGRIMSDETFCVAFDRAELISYVNKDA